MARQAKRKELVQIRRGLYLPSGGWNSMKEWEQFAVRIHAVQATAKIAPVFCGQSGAVILGLPLIDTPREVETLVRRTTGGGRSKNGVRRRFGDPGSANIVTVDGLQTTPVTETLRDLAARLPLAHALPAFDATLDRAGNAAYLGHGIASQAELRGRLLGCLDELSATKQARVRRVLAAADARSGSPGESLSRAVMIQAGFPVPELQARFTDRRGLIGYTHYYWPEHGLVGEFDGWAKYSRGKYLQGRLPEDVLRAEKIREDRLRATGLRVVRWMWQEARNAAALCTKLREAGLRPTRSHGNKSAPGEERCTPSSGGVVPYRVQF
ncbi:hypothetical protein [Arthrobacter cavernae]|uniref:Transcriptional regulator, AbiEi antitoxin, Type IV TA system n=1 Tax=Arthrobacter cavernae TaxID=2817681 RepID=A0A939HC12_9MICC|nr:hypothetical protein [Arthrobacter cavernae]MBO1267021.1 hypothetical protein [Arthrobacter cavernae]